MTTNAADIIERYVDFSYCEDVDTVSLSEWLATDIVRLIELLDEELQIRYNAESAIATGAWSSDE